jgi:hypothetical protein
MKNIKQIREQFDLITEKEEKEGQKLSALVRAGLYDAKKLPALKKALEKSADKMTSQEKRMLLNLLDSLISQVVSDDQVYRKVRQNVHSMNEAKEDYLSKFDPRFKAGYPSDRDIPSVLILKRKAIRVYPDNQKVALYYSQALDKYVTIPFSDIQLGVNEEIELQEGKVSDFTYGDLDDLTLGSVGKDLTPGLGTARAAERTKRAWNKGNYGSAALNAADAALSGVSDAALAVPVAGTALSGLIKGGLATVKGLRAGYRAYKKYKAVKATKAASTANKVDNATDAAKTANKVDNATDAAKIVRKTKPKGKFSTARRLTGKVLRLTGKAARLGIKAAARAAAGAGNAAPVGNGVISKGANPEFGKLKLNTGSAFSNTTDAEKATKERSRQATVKALTTEEVPPSGLGVLSSGKNPQFRLKPGTSRSSRPFNRLAATDELNRRRQLASLTKVTNESVIDTIKNMVTNNIQETKLSFNEQEITINNTVAKKLLSVYESVNKTNKNKMEQMLNESATSFNKVLTFAVRQ